MWSKKIAWLLSLACCIGPAMTANARESKQQKRENTETLRILIYAVQSLGTESLDPVAASRVQGRLDMARDAFAKVSHKLTPKKKEDVDKALTRLGDLVAKKADSDAVVAASRETEQLIYDRFKVFLAPAQTPDFALGERTYHQSCASCHGVKALGDGPLARNKAVTMNPPPANFRDDRLVATSSPFRHYNVTLVGVPGSVMPAFGDLLPDHDMWSAAFYLQALPRVAKVEAGGGKRTAQWQTLSASERQALSDAKLTLEVLARYSDDGLGAWLRENVKSLRDASPKELDRIITVLRVDASFRPELPRE